MSKSFNRAEVAQHNSAESCWVVLYGIVYDVTAFLAHHPGGSKIILQLAGQDATEAYDPVHPEGTLEENLPPEARLGIVHAEVGDQQGQQTEDEQRQNAQKAVDMEDLLNLADIEELATKQISPKAWAYYYSAADDLVSKQLNNAAYRSILLRPRIFVDCADCDTSTTIIGHRLASPIFVSPAAMARLAHPAGEAGIAAACAKYGILQMISQNASMTPEQIVKEARPGQIFAWQLYVQTDTAKSENMIARINKLSDRIKFIVLTLDAPVPGKREHDERAKTVGAKLATPSATKAGQGSGKPGGIGAQLFFGTSARLTWKTTLPWLAKHTSLPIVLKGVQTHEDAYLASQHAPQVRGIILSNHGGRAADTAPPAVHTLLEIRKFCPEVFDKTEVFCDGGIKRGTDVVKALCLGARGVGIGRPALFGLGAGGPAGVERVLQILQDELMTAMRLLGARNVVDLNMTKVNVSALEQQIYCGPEGFGRSHSWAGPKL